MTSKRDVMLALAAGQTPPYVPAAFFLHFDPAYHSGQAAIDKHLQYFRHTEMDFVKIQYEKPFPALEHIRTPADWGRMPRYGADFYAEPLAVVRGLVQAARSEAPVVLTLYSPFMQAAYTAGDDLLTAHLNEAPERVARGLDIITDSLLEFVRACIKAGIDGFYHSTQGGEAGRFTDKRTFERYVQPYDRALMDEVNRACPFNILHVCDYKRDYDDFTPFLGYPGHIVNTPLKVGTHHLTPIEAAGLFGRPFMGGLERKGVLAAGTPQAVEREVNRVLAHAPAQFVLAADCTVPADTSWNNLRTAVRAAHTFRRTPSSAENRL